jgi:molecular chaperone DnaK
VGIAGCGNGHTVMLAWPERVLPHPFAALVAAVPRALRTMLPTHAVGIDLGTTYSCIAYLNEHGEPVTIPNHDGELSTPSVVMFDGGQVIVGTEALRNSVRAPDRVVMHAKRYMGDPNHVWTIQGKSYSPVDISTHILRTLLNDARQRIGEVDRAVITVPAQFSDVQRQATAEAGRRAGLKQVDIINEPVAAALCFVLGSEGIWFTELATSQVIMVVDLGGGTFDLSLVQYEKNAVRVIASGGDLHLGGLDWNNTLQKAIVRQFQKEFGVDPAGDRESLQALALEIEQTKRSLSVRPKAALTCQHAGRRKTYQIELEQFERLSKPHVDRMRDLTKALLQENQMGWAHIDVVLTTGGASRMPMVRHMLKQLSGRTLNTSLSPDQSIAHGATYYAGMLLTNSAFARSILNPTAAARLAQFQQQSVNARALGILVRDMKRDERVPHYLLPANTRLPASAKQIVGTVVANQQRAHLHVVESGTAADVHFVELGTCVVDPLPENLPDGSEIEVTIRYDEQARVHVSAKVLKNGQTAHAEIVRPENLKVSALQEGRSEDDVAVKSAAEDKPIRAPAPLAIPTISLAESERPVFAAAGATSPGGPDSSDVPVALCATCAEPLDAQGRCPKCAAARRTAAPKPMVRGVPAPPSGTVKASASGSIPALPSEDEIIELGAPAGSRPQRASASKAAGAPKVKPPPLPGPLASGTPSRAAAEKAGEDEFWRITKRKP